MQFHNKQLYIFFYFTASKEIKDNVFLFLFFTICITEIETMHIKICCLDPLVSFDDS